MALRFPSCRYALVVDQAAQRIAQQRATAKAGRLKSAGWNAAIAVQQPHAPSNAPDAAADDAAHGIHVSDTEVVVGDVRVVRRGASHPQLVPRVYFVPIAAQVCRLRKDSLQCSLDVCLCRRTPGH